MIDSIEGREKATLCHGTFLNTRNLTRRRIRERRDRSRIHLLAHKVFCCFCFVLPLSQTSYVKMRTTSTNALHTVGQSIDDLFIDQILLENTSVIQHCSGLHNKWDILYVVPRGSLQPTSEYNTAVTAVTLTTFVFFQLP